MTRRQTASKTSTGWADGTLIVLDTEGCQIPSFAPAPTGGDKTHVETWGYETSVPTGPPSPRH